MDSCESWEVAKVVFHRFLPTATAVVDREAALSFTMIPGTESLQNRSISEANGKWSPVTSNENGSG